MGRAPPGTLSPAPEPIKRRGREGLRQRLAPESPQGVGLVKEVSTQGQDLQLAALAHSSQLLLGARLLECVNLVITEEGAGCSVTSVIIFELKYEMEMGRVRHSSKDLNIGALPLQP